MKFEQIAAAWRSAATKGVRMETSARSEVVDRILESACCCCGDGVMLDWKECVRVKRKDEGIDESMNRWTSGRCCRLGWMSYSLRGLGMGYLST